MSQENIEIVRRLYDWVDWHGWSAAFAAPELHPDCELTFVAGPQAGTHRGAAQIEAVLADLQAGFESWIAEPVEVLDSGDQVVVTHKNRLRPKGGDSGEFEYRNGFVYTISDGLIVSAVGYPTPEEALEAARLSEQAMSHENVEIMRTMLDAFDRRDRAAWLALHVRECEVIPSAMWPEVDAIRGREAAWDFYVEVAEPFQRRPLAPDTEAVDAGPDKVALHHQTVVRGRASGAHVELNYWVILTFREGKVLRDEWFTDRAEALEAAGLSE